MIVCRERERRAAVFRDSGGGWREREYGKVGRHPVKALGEINVLAAHA